jgi:exodeoxyribonuclease III
MFAQVIFRIKLNYFYKTKNIFKMRIISYNVNGIRAALNKGLLPWIEQSQPDILCIQEVKALPEQVDLSPLTQMGYQGHWFSAVKKGYSGVLTLSKIPVLKVEEGMGHPLYDAEGRVLRTDFQGFSLFNTYFPSGTSGEERQAVKIQFLEDFRQWMQDLKVPRAIVAGDYNIAHTEQDIHNPKGNKNTSGFLPEERQWMTEWFDMGYVDAYRHKHPDKTEYSWWSYRNNARQNNKGWRIDYLSLSQGLENGIVNCYHDAEALHSDHCPVVLDWQLP